MLRGSRVSSATDCASLAFSSMSANVDDVLVAKAFCLAATATSAQQCACSPEFYSPGADHLQTLTGGVG
jgi:hypothetical protein